MRKFNVDKTTVLGVVGGLMVLIGQVAKGISDKKAADIKLKETVEKVVTEKLQDK